MTDVNKYLTHLSKQQVLVCRDCKYCLQPNDIQRHLQTKHLAISLDVRQELVRYAEELLLPISSEVVTSTTIVPAFECLEVTDEFCCLICDSLCGTIRSVEEHCRCVHQWTKSKGIYSSKLFNNISNTWWKSQKIQTFFLDVNKKYFAITVTNPPPSNSDKMKLLNQMLESAKLKDKELCSERNIVKKDKEKTENSPWLGRTDWKEMFLKRDMKRLVRFTDKDVTLEPELQLVKDSVHRVIEKGLEGVRDLDTRRWNELRFWLRSHQKDKSHGKSFRKYYIKMKDYADVWMQLILFCWRTFELKNCDAEFLPKQRKCLIKFRDMVCLQDVSNEKLNAAVLRLSISFIKHSNFQKKRSIIKYFEEVLEYKLSESRWRRSAEYTPRLAVLQFCVRVISLEHCLPLKKRNGYVYRSNATPLTMFQDFHSVWLIDGAGCPFSYIHKLLNYGMGACKDATGGDKLQFYLLCRR